MRTALFFVSLLLSFNTFAANHLDTDINTILGQHYQSYKDKEYFSGIALSIYTPSTQIKSYYYGHTGHEKNSPKINSHTLFEIGSITKSYTSAIILQLSKENKLTLTQALTTHLPEYSKWSNLTIKSLLNMTSGLPNYSDAPLLNSLIFEHPHQALSAKELINYVYPRGKLTPPLQTGYHYTNTGYILSGMIIEKITQHELQTEIHHRILQPLQLHDTFYPLPHLDHTITARLANGYGFNPYVNPELVGKEVSSDNLSWAGAAGAMLATTADVVQWVKALFIDDQLLDASQKQMLTRLISTQTGKSIVKTTANDPRGFGLGVVQNYDKEIGNFWFYEGETSGFRAMYVYVPSSKVIIAASLNSAVNAENDHIQELLLAVYKKIAALQSPQ